MPGGRSACGSMLWPTKPRTTVCGVEQVLQLQYRVRWLSDDVSVRNDAAPVMVRLAGFSCRLSGETLIAEPSCGLFLGRRRPRSAGACLARLGSIRLAAEVILHAGDVCVPSELEELSPTRQCMPLLGNNDSPARGHQR